LKDYAGDYSNPGYGTVSIAPDGDKFKVTLNKVTRSLEHYHYDVFQVPADPLDNLEKMKVVFLTDMDGDISSLSMPLQPDVKDIVFIRVPDGSSPSAASSRRSPATMRFRDLRCR